MDALTYWIQRIEPLIRAEDEEEIIVVFCNRCGTDRGMNYAGTSAVLGIVNGEVTVYGLLGRGVKELLVVDTHDAPLGKLVQRPDTEECETQTLETDVSDQEQSPDVVQQSSLSLRGRKGNYENLPITRVAGQNAKVNEGTAHNYPSPSLSITYPDPTASKRMRPSTPKLLIPEFGSLVEPVSCPSLETVVPKSTVRPHDPRGIDDGGLDIETPTGPSPTPQRLRPNLSILTALRFGAGRGATPFSYDSNGPVTADRQTGTRFAHEGRGKGTGRDLTPYPHSNTPRAFFGRGALNPINASGRLCDGKPLVSGGCPQARPNDDALSPSTPFELDDFGTPLSPVSRMPIQFLPFPYQPINGAINKSGVGNILNERSAAAQESPEAAKAILLRGQDGIEGPSEGVQTLQHSSHTRSRDTTKTNQPQSRSRSSNGTQTIRLPSRSKSRDPTRKGTHSESPTQIRPSSPNSGNAGGARQRDGQGANHSPREWSTSPPKERLAPFEHFPTLAADNIPEAAKKAAGETDRPRSPKSRNSSRSRPIDFSRLTNKRLDSLKGSIPIAVSPSIFGFMYNANRPISSESKQPVQGPDGRTTSQNQSGIYARTHLRTKSVSHDPFGGTSPLPSPPNTAKSDPASRPMASMGMSRVLDSGHSKKSPDFVPRGRSVSRGRQSTTTSTSVSMSKLRSNSTGSTRQHKGDKSLRRRAGSAHQTISSPTTNVIFTPRSNKGKLKITGKTSSDDFIAIISHSAHNLPVRSHVHEQDSSTGTIDDDSPIYEHYFSQSIQRLAEMLMQISPVASTGAQSFLTADTVRSPSSPLSDPPTPKVFLSTGLNSRDQIRFT
jgi:hypothetical protein